MIFNARIASQSCVTDAKGCYILTRGTHERKEDDTDGEN
jgi:hypothetical protein